MSSGRYTDTYEGKVSPMRAATGPRQLYHADDSRVLADREGMVVPIWAMDSAQREVTRQLSGYWIPTVDCCKTKASEEPQFDLSTTVILGGGAFLSILVWTLAIAKVIDLYGLH